MANKAQLSSINEARGRGAPAAPGKGSVAATAKPHGKSHRSQNYVSQRADGESRWREKGVSALYRPVAIWLRKELGPGSKEPVFLIKTGPKMGPGAHGSNLSQTLDRL